MQKQTGFLTSEETNSQFSTGCTGRSGWIQKHAFVSTFFEIFLNAKRGLANFLTGEIICMAHADGSCHDLELYEEPIGSAVADKLNYPAAETAGYHEGQNVYFAVFLRFQYMTGGDRSGSRGL
jgi:hypothetical protein